MGKFKDLEKLKQWSHSESQREKSERLWRQHLPTSRPGHFPNNTWALALLTGSSPLPPFRRSCSRVRPKEKVSQTDRELRVFIILDYSHLF